MAVFMGAFLVYQGITPSSSSIPVVTVLLGMFTLFGVVAFFIGLKGLIKTFRNIYRHFKKKKTVQAV